MRPVSLFIATSLDSFIASPDGGIDWLFTDGDYGYAAFIANVDALLMGYKTYKVMLGFGDEYLYSDKQNYVFSRNHQHSDGNPVTFVADDPAGFVRELKQQEGKTIWLVGGGQINTLMLNAGLIDEIIISIHPIILGEGLPLFAGKPERTGFTHVKTESFASGLVQITYQKS